MILRLRAWLRESAGPGLALAAALAVAASARAAPPAASSPLVPTPAKAVAVRIDAVVSVPPLKGIVEALLAPVVGGAGRVQSVIPVGVSEHGYEIPPSRLRALAEADLVVFVGLGLEPQIEKFLKQHSVPGRKTVEFARVAGVEADAHEHHHHGHGEGEECDHHHAADPHLWLDPVMVEKLAGAVRERLEQTIRDRTAGASTAAAVEELNARHGALVERIRAVDERYRSTLGRATSRTIVVAHDAYGWLARRYDLKVVPLAGLTASEPTPAAIERAINAVKAEGGGGGVTTVFAEPQLPSAAARRVAAATGAELRMLDPLGNGDWFALMESNLAAIAAALGVVEP